MVFYKSGAVVVGLGLFTVTSAFLLPTEVSSTEFDTFMNTLDVGSAQQANTRQLSFECSGCPVAVPNNAGPHSWILGSESKLQLSFAIDRTIPDVDILLMNGVQIYPPTQIVKTSYATQISEHGQSDLPFGFELSIPPALKSETSLLELITINLQIFEIGGKFVNGLELVALTLIKTPRGSLMIGKLNTATTRNPTINPSEEGKHCTTLICRWRAVIAAKITHLKSSKGGCSKAASIHNFPSGALHPHHRHGPPHRQHHRHRGGIVRFVHAMESIAVHVIIPAIIGVAIGLTASIIGMLVGHVIVFFWRTVYRGGQKGSYSKVQQEESAVLEETNDDDKLSLEYQSLPPVYEDVVQEKNH